MSPNQIGGFLAHGARRSQSVRQQVCLQRNVVGLVAERRPETRLRSVSPGKALKMGVQEGLCVMFVNPNSGSFLKGSGDNSSTSLT